MALYSLLILYVLLHFGFLKVFGTCGQKPKKTRENKEKSKPITFISHEVVFATGAVSDVEEYTVFSSLCFFFFGLWCAWV